MEITIAYFWALKIGVILITLYVLYIAIVRFRLKSFAFNTLSAILILIQVFTPFRMQQPSVSTQQTTFIQQTKVLPPKVADKSFKQAVQEVSTITTNELE